MPFVLSAERRSPRKLNADASPTSPKAHQASPLRKPARKIASTPVMLNGYSPNTSAKLNGVPPQPISSASKSTTTPVRPYGSVNQTPQLNGRAVDRPVKVAANAAKRRFSDVSFAKPQSESTRSAPGKRGPRKLVGMVEKNMDRGVRQLNEMNVVREGGKSEASLSEIGRRKRVPMKIRKSVGIGNGQAG